MPLATLRSLALGASALWAALAIGLDAWGCTRAPVGTYDAIVVAGCRVDPDGTPSPALAHRVALAVELHRKGLAPRVVFTGGLDDAVRAADPNGPTEARAAARYARDLGLPKRAVVLEERSTSTLENATFAAELLPATRVLVVTDAYHVFRARRVFAGVFPEADAVGSRYGRWSRIRGAMREVLAVAGYAARGAL